MENKIEKEQISENQSSAEIQPDVYIPESPKFYETTWFLWLSIILFWPLGAILLWKVHNARFKTGAKIGMIILGIFCGAVLYSGDSNKTETPKVDGADSKVKVAVANFNEISKDAAKTWCTTNKIACSFDENYSDTVQKDKLISQSVEPNQEIRQGSSLSIVYSLGKKPSIEFLNALKKAESYSNHMHMSKQGIYDQLVSSYGEGFSKEAAQYAIDNMKADWNKNALEKAKSYSETMNMSKNAIKEQLVSSYGEKFTEAQAKYAIDHLYDE